MRQLHKGPSSERRRFNFARDPLRVKPDLFRYGITNPMIAARGPWSLGFVGRVLRGDKTSVYVERAIADLIREARERTTAEPTTAAAGGVA